MTDDRVLRLLTEVLDGFPSSAPDSLLASVLERVRTAPQRGRWRSVRGWLRFAPDLQRRRPAATSLLVVLAAVVAIAVVQLVPSGAISGPGNPSPSPTPPPSVAPSPTPGPSVTPPRSAFDGTLVPIENTGSAGLMSGIAYTSRAFDLQVAFRLLGPVAGQSTIWCSTGSGSDSPPPYTSPHMIVLGEMPACVSDLRIIQPFGVDCGTPDAHPDSATLAAAILANHGMGIVHDRGLLQTPGVVPAGLFFEPYQGRVIEVIRSRNLDPKATDPDRCRLLSEPGSGDPTIEIRGDLSATLILFDVGGELVIVRAGAAGYDGPTEAAAEARGYGNLEVMGAMLTSIRGIEFR